MNTVCFCNSIWLVVEILEGEGRVLRGIPGSSHSKKIISPMRKTACNMHVPTNYMHVVVNMHVTLLLRECYMHVVRVL